MSDLLLVCGVRRWKRLMWAFASLLIVCCLGTIVEVLGLFGARQKHLAWSGVFWILFCMAQIAMAAAFWRGFRRELDRREHDDA